MTQDEHIDPFDYIDKSDRYYDYYDTVVKRANSDVLIVRWHCDFLPGNPPYKLTFGKREEIPLTALTPDSRKHAERIAASLEGGDKPLQGKSWENYNEGTETHYGKVTLINPPHYISQYSDDDIWKRASGEVVVLRRGLVFAVSSAGKEQLLGLTSVEVILLTRLTDEARERVLQLAANLEGNDTKIRGKSWCGFKWNDDPARKDDPTNHLVTLRGEDATDH
jgi:hypothetical protein